VCSKEQFPKKEIKNTLKVFALLYQKTEILQSEKLKLKGKVISSKMERISKGVKKEVLSQDK
jgi:hypothetical protein